MYLYPNPGNAGDFLIASATFQLLKKHRIEYQIPDWNTFDFEGKTIFYSGGGNLTGYYKNAHDLLKNVHQKAKKVVVLPHTIHDEDDLLSELGENVDLICREHPSYNYTKEKTSSGARVFLSNDLAFHLDIQELNKNRIGFCKILIKKSFAKLTKRNIQRAISPRWYIKSCQLFKELKQSNPSSILNCFRQDLEKTDVHIPENNLDIPFLYQQVFGPETKNEALVNYVSSHLLYFLNHYQTIHTNRLHMAIAGGLLGKEVHFFPNSYFKCKAVYEYSIKDRFPNVLWQN